MDKIVRHFQMSSHLVLLDINRDNLVICGFSNFSELFVLLDGCNLA